MAKGVAGGLEPVSVAFDIRNKFCNLSSSMHEKLRRHWAACEARALGYGGIAAVCRASGISPTTLRHGICEIREQMPQIAAEARVSERIRRSGGGRKPLTEQDATLSHDLQDLVDSDLPHEWWARNGCVS